MEVFMDEDSMVSLSQKENIKNLLHNILKSFKPKITLWQNINDVRRIWKIVSFKKIDVEREELVFIPRQGLFQFDSKLPIYFYAKDKTTIFKNMIFYNSSTNIAIKTPELIMLKNIRLCPRRIVTDDKKEFVRIFYGKDLIKGNGTYFKSQLVDYSEKGFAFKSSLNNVIKFEKGSEIEFRFENMNDFRLGVISNVSVHLTSDLRHNYYRIGVALKE